MPTVQIERNVCITGHRPDRFGGHDESAPQIIAVKEALRSAVREAYDRGFRRFISGMAQGVDTWAAEAVIELRAERTEVRLIAAVPFVTQPNLWPREATERWERILRSADQVWNTMDGSRWPVELLINEADRMFRERERLTNTTPLIMHRNRWMVDRAALVIAVWDAAPSGTANAVRYAAELGREVVRIDPTLLRVE